jgi:hypothetical protein
MMKKKVKIDKTIITKMETVSLLSTKNDQLEKEFFYLSVRYGALSSIWLFKCPKAEYIVSFIGCNPSDKVKEWTSFSISIQLMD